MHARSQDSTVPLLSYKLQALFRLQTGFRQLTVCRRQHSRGSWLVKLFKWSSSSNHMLTLYKIHQTVLFVLTHFVPMCINVHLSTCLPFWIPKYIPNMKFNITFKSYVRVNVPTNYPESNIITVVVRGRYMSAICLFQF